MDGVHDTLKALGRGQVRTLLVDPDVAEPGFRGVASGRLGLMEADLRGEGEVVAVLDVVDDAIEEALRQRVTVNVVFEPAAKKATARKPAAKKTTMRRTAARKPAARKR